MNSNFVCDRPKMMMQSGAFKNPIYNMPKICLIYNKRTEIFLDNLINYVYYI